MTTNKAKTSVKKAAAETKVAAAKTVAAETKVAAAKAKAAAKTVAAKAKAAAKAETKAAAKTVAAETKAKAKAAKVDNRLIQAIPGCDDKFYQKFPRYAAYRLLLSKKENRMPVTKFLEAVEKLEGVKSRNQANGILQKLIDKKRHVGVVCAKLIAA